MRENTSKRFKSLSDVDMSKLTFDESSVEDVMCSRIIRSLMLGNSISKREMTFLNTFNALLEGESYEGISDDIKSLMEYRMENEVPSPLETKDIEAEITTVDMIPDTTEFDNSIKEAFVRAIENATAYVKEASSVGLPILTGAVLQGLEDGKEDPDRDLESTSPFEGTAEEIIRQVITKDEKTNKPVEDDEEGEEAASGFNLFFDKGE